MDSNITLIEHPIRVMDDGSLLVKILCIESVDGVAGVVFNHLMRIEPDANIDVAIRAVVDENNAHLNSGVTASDGNVRQFPALSSSALLKIKERAAKVWTPQVLDTWNKKRENARLQEEQQKLLQQKDEEMQIEMAKKAFDKQFISLKQRLLTDPDVLTAFITSNKKER